MKKYILPLLCAVATVYTVWYMHFGVPYKNSGALSKIGLMHHGYFVLWGVLTFAALSLGIVRAYRRYTQTKIYLPLLCLSGVGMALTLAFDFDFSKMPDYYFHCAGSLLFSVITGTTIFVLFAMLYKKDTLYKIFTYLTAALLLGDLVLLLIFKETALIEVVPIFAGYAMLSIADLRRETVELTR